MLALPALLFLVAPLVLILTCASLLPVPVSESPKEFNCKGWYWASGVLLAICLPLGWLANTELGHHLFHQSHGETTSAVIVIVGMMMSFIVAVLGSTQRI